MFPGNRAKGRVSVEGADGFQTEQSPTLMSRCTLLLFTQRKTCIPKKEVAQSRLSNGLQRWQLLIASKKGNFIWQGVKEGS